MSVLIGADFVPTENNLALFEKGDAAALLGEPLARLLSEADHRVFNLEMPLSDAGNPIDKCGPNLLAPPSAVTAYSAIRADLLTLANNHILDYGEKALRKTEKLLDDAGIAHVGAGSDLAEAKQPSFFLYAGKRVGVYACTEHEFSSADEKAAGANPFDPLETPDDIRSLRAQCGYLIVLYHGGKEYYRYPTPNLQKVCRKLADCGADLVICQHSHCVGCEEDYHGKKIVYGQGNALFCLSHSEEWQTGLLVSLNEDFTVSYLPLRQTENGTSLAQGEDAETILSGFYQRSEEIKAEGFVDRAFGDYAGETLPAYLDALEPKRSLIFYALNKLTGHRLLPKRREKRYGKEVRIALENHIECESHRELFVRGLREKRAGERKK